MGNAILMILRPLLVSMIFSSVKLILKVALNGVDAWLKRKVESTDNKYDDAAYQVFLDNKTGIMDALDRVVSLIAGK
jgi:hypothetical protein